MPMLGKLPKIEDPRTFKLARYLPARPALPAPPPSIDWSVAVPSWPMLMNDQIGDCVVAAALHSIQEWRALAGSGFSPTNSDALKVYEAFGYVPGDPSTDNGIAMLPFLKYWRTHGIAGHKITAFVEVDLNNPIEIKQAIALFGNVFAGFAMPATAANQLGSRILRGYADEKLLWCVPGGLTGDAAPGSWGGHCVPILEYVAGARYPRGYKIVSWGSVYTATEYFARCYLDEAYAMVSLDFIDNAGLSASGFNLAQLEADLKAL